MLIVYRELKFVKNEVVINIVHLNRFVKKFKVVAESDLSHQLCKIEDKLDVMIDKIKNYLDLFFTNENLERFVNNRLYLDLIDCLKKENNEKLIVKYKELSKEVIKLLREFDKVMYNSFFTTALIYNINCELDKVESLLNQNQ